MGTAMKKMIDNWPLVGVLIGCFILSVGSLAILHYYTPPKTNAIKLVKNNYVSAHLTTGDMINDDITSFLSIGVDARVKWSAVNEDNGRYIVTANEQIKEFGEWVEFQTMQWRVNLDTEEIAALDNTARAYL